jgi:glycine betaine/proline transport system substrate-binding protein
MYLPFFLLSLLFSLPSSNCLASNKTEKILIPLNDWASQRVISTAIGQLIEQKNIPVEYVEISTDDQWGALQRGIIHFQIEVWQPSMANQFEPLVLANAINDLGTHDALVVEDWWYPKYAEETCLELPNWQAINKCKFTFADESSPDKNTFYAGPWDYGDADLIRALKLNVTLQRLENETALVKKLKHSLINMRPILIFNWSPNWTDNYVEGNFIAFPSYQKACETTPDWGINKKLVKDCGNPTNGWLKKAAWPGLKEKSPCVYQLIKNINLSNQMIADASAMVVVDNLSEQESALKWLTKYQTAVKTWSSDVCTR